ncbi:MAG: translation initiation factor IF-2 [Candidatus Babeliales bacterium]
MRVYEIAKELAISSKEILSALEKKNIVLASHMSQISDDTIKVIREIFGKKKSEIKPTEAQQKGNPEPMLTTKHTPTEEKKGAAFIDSTKDLSLPEGLSNNQPQEKVSIKQSFLKAEDLQELEREPQVQEKVSKILISKGFIQKPFVKKRQRRFRRRQRQVFHKEQDFKAPVTEITLTKSLSVGQTAQLLGRPVGDVILALLKKGMACNINHLISVEVIQQLATSYGIKSTMAQQETTSTKKIAHTEGITRWPIAVVMGHVDHGKTTLLDYVRKMNVAGGEKGGITQHLGAYEVDSTHGKIVFLDTPGHEAFSFIRERGSRITDIAVLIVAADDGIKPQTVEAINHAKAAGVPIIVAINKIDKVSSTAAIETIKRQLVKYELMPEDWGGQTIVVPISAKTGLGVNELLEMIILQAQMMDLKADPTAQAKAFVLESRMEKGFGPVATVICTQGTLKQGDFFICGTSTGKVRLLKNSFGQKVTQAPPSQPVQVIGFDNFASIGDYLTVVPMQQYLDVKSKQSTVTSVTQSEASSVAQLPKQHDKHAKKSHSNQNINLIIKTDTRGSKEAIMDSIDKLIKQNKDIKCPIRVVVSTIGDVSEGDVELAENTDAIILTLHVRTEKNAMLMAKEKGVNLQAFDIIYKMLEYLQELLNSKREVVTIWKKVGEASVRKVFDIKGVGIIAGCYMRDGIMTNKSKVECVRNGRVIGEAKITSLQRDKKSVKEIHAGYECGFVTESFKDWAEGDTVVCYIEEKEK